MLALSPTYDVARINAQQHIDDVKSLNVRAAVDVLKEVRNVCVQRAPTAEPVCSARPQPNLF